jgi:rare lipoprotein A
MLEKLIAAVFGLLFKLIWRAAKGLMLRPLAVMMLATVGMVACSGDNGRNSYDVSSGSPYGGTSKPTRVKIGSSYSIKGETYSPRFEPAYSETGMASWYGPGFHGRQTASGEKYDQYQHTAAHRTLPLPSIVRVTRVDTGESIKVRVNDRGPFHGNRIIDLSKAAANDLRMIGSGTARVKVEYLHDETMGYIADLGLEAPAEMRLASGSKWQAKGTNTMNMIKETPVRNLAWQKSNLAVSQVKTANNQTLEKITAAELAPINKPNYTKPAFKLAWAKPVSELGGVEKIKAVSSNNTNNSDNDLDLDSLISGAISKPQQQATSQFRVQTAAFSNLANAKQHAKTLQPIAKPLISEIDKDGTTLYRVSLSPVGNYEVAMAMLKKTKAMGYRDARLMVE